MASPNPCDVQPVAPNSPKLDWDIDKWRWLTEQFEIIRNKLDELDARVAALEP